MIVISYRNVYEPIGQEIVSTACPLCQSETGVRLELYRLVVETSGIVRYTKKITSSARCEHCLKDIPVTKWTKPMQDSFEHVKRNSRLESKVVVRKRFWWTIGIGFGAIAVLLSVALIGGSISSRRASQERAQFEAITTNPQVNDKLIVMTIQDGTILNTLYKITALDDTTITAVASKQTNTNPVAKFSDFDSSDLVFTGESVKIVKSGFLKYQNWNQVGQEENYSVASVVRVARREQ
jgi:hypothetical protein